MKRSLIITAAGAIGGALVALIGIAMSSGLIIDGGAGFEGRGTLTAGTDATYLLVLLFGLLGGGLIAYLTAAISRTWNPNETRFGAGPIGAAGSVAGAIAAYIMLRTGLGIGATITNEVITVSAFRAVVILLAAGAVAGAVASLSADRLSQPATLGLAGEAWPGTTAAFLKESMPAMLIPLLAIVLVAVAVVVLGQGLVALAEGLHESGITAAVIAASVVATLILAGAAFLAYRGGDNTPQA